jgi:TctA family transporter
VALKFHPADYFSLMVFGLVAAVILAHGSVVKAIGMILTGMLLGTVGIDVTRRIARVYGIVLTHRISYFTVWHNQTGDSAK